MGRPPGSQGSETRERILDVAQELFTRHGYDKTSLRDIAARLQITKAALYYYFERKEDILIALHLRLQTLGASVLDELEAAPDGPARAAIWPRLADQMIDFMVENRELILLHQRNRNAFRSLEMHPVEENRDVEARFERIIASAAIPLRERVRMAAMVGVITEVFAESAEAFQDVPAGQLAELVREAIGELDPAPADRRHANVPARNRTSAFAALSARSAPVDDSGRC
jgi:AcrR family transcriptional regulator